MIIQRYKDSEISHFILELTGLLSLILGIVVIFGWITVNSAIIQVLPTYPQMQPNTAICFALSGLALIATSLDRKFISWLATFIVIFIAGTTVVQYVSHINLGIDQLFIHHDYAAHNPFPGRIAPNTAISFLLLGIAIILMTLPRSQNYIFIAQTISGIVSAITFAVFLSYIFGVVNLTIWWSLTGMAIHTSLGLLVISAGIFIYNFTLKASNYSLPETILGITFFAITLTLIFWRSFQNEESISDRMIIEKEAEYISKSISINLDQTSNALKRLEQRLILTDIKNDELLTLEFNSYMEYFQWIIAMGIFDDKLDSIKIKGNFEHAKETLSLNHSKEIFRIKKSVFFIYPLKQNSTILAAEISLPILIENVLKKDVLNDYLLTIYIGNDLIYENNPDQLSDKQNSYIYNMNYQNENWMIQIFPSKKLLPSHVILLPALILTTGALTTFLLIAVISLAFFATESKKEVLRLLSMKEQNLAFRQAILDSSAYSTIATDKNGKILFFNKAAEHLLGYSEKEMVEKQTPEVFHDKNEIIKRAEEFGINPGFEVFVKLARNGIVETREWTYIHKNGKRLQVALSITAVKDDQNRLIGYLGTAQDITQIKESERLKNELIAITSHELRSPITAIRGSLGLLTVPENQQSLLGIAIKNCDRLVHLTNDILDIQKMESGAQDFEFHDIWLPVLIQQATEANQGLAMGKKAKIVVASNPPDVTVYADQDRLIQVLNNLLSNAIKYTPINGQVTISSDIHDSFVRIIVSDQGPRIPEKYRSLIFQKFSQVPETGKTGTGLGLTIAKAIVEKHHGSIGFDTSPRGSSFWFTLPIKN